MTITDPDQIEREPEVIVYSLLMDEWDADNISGTFTTDWLHTGWYNSSNQNAQISVTPRDEGPVNNSPTGYTGIDSSGAGPTAWIDGQVDVNVWVPHDSHPYDVTGVNPKKLAGELKREVKRIIGRHARGTTYNGQRELQRLATGQITSPPEPEGTDVENRYHIPALFAWFQGRKPPEDDETNGDE